MKKIAIIGFGCAGYNAALAIRQADSEALIHIYSNTDEAPYNPMLTTYYTSGKIDESAMFPMGDLEKLAAQLGADIFCSSPVKRLCAKSMEITTENGKSEKYDDIVIASGARAVLPPIGKMPERGIFTMRTANDARRLAAALDEGVESAVVIGAQMVGIKVVELLIKRGVKTTLADMAEQMFPTSAYDTTARILEGRLRSTGTELILGSAVKGVRECEQGLECSFDNGKSLRADIVVFCSGIRPNIDFVDREEIEVGTGIKTDLHMRTSAGHIYACGDCCETKNAIADGNAYIGLWANSSRQGRTAGRNIAGADDEYDGNLIHNITHYMDTDFISIGDVHAQGERIFWEKADGSWRIEATMQNGRMAALNILDRANIAGSVKNALLHQAAHPGRGLSASAKMLLQDSGVPEGFIIKLGGDGK